MAKPIKAYDGGVHIRVQYGVRADGACFRRIQSKGLRGYVWSAWKKMQNFDMNSPLPASISAGFSECRAAGMYSGWEKWRLPNV